MSTYTYYDKSHSITFGPGTFTSDGRLTGKNTWNDWHLIPTARPDVIEPEFYQKRITVPGRHGAIDASEWLSGAPIFLGRSGSWDFLIDSSRPSWQMVKDELTQYLHGKSMKCVLEDEPGRCYEGRFTVSFQSGENNSQVSIGYTLWSVTEHSVGSDSGNSVSEQSTARYVYYDKTHSITFGKGGFSADGKLSGKNTWNDWCLIPTARPDATEPEVTRSQISIPGIQGIVDTSEWLTGGPVYMDRTGSWSFIIDSSKQNLQAIKDEITEYLHGKAMKCVLEDDPNYYYEGRFTVHCQSGEGNCGVTINYILAPYAHHWNPTGDWLWDPFNFLTDRTDQAIAEKI